MARKRKPKGTTKTRSRKQAVRENYSKTREEAQLLGLLPTTPEGALRDERVDPSSQGEQVIISIPLAAARNGWATPDAKKPVVVDELVKLVEAGDERDEEGKLINPGPPPIVKVMAANALGKLDQMQFERDNPEQAGKAKGSISIANSNQVNVVDETRRLLEAVEGQVGCDEIEARLRLASQTEQVNVDDHVEAVAGDQGAVVASSEVLRQGSWGYPEHG